MTEWTKSSSEFHQYIWSNSDVRAVFPRPLYRTIIASEPFQRLADIRFLGAIDYFVHPSGVHLNRRRHNRFDHTLGVAHLALRFSRAMGLTEQSEKLLVTGALLHDIGHSPLSHSLEAAFRKHFAIDHHQAGSQIILGRGPGAFGSSLARAMRSENIDPDEIIALINGKSHAATNFLFAHPINIDTIEAITRSETYIKGLRTTSAPEIVFEGLMHPETGGARLDEFWDLKDKVYRHLIQGPIGLFADYIATSYVEDNISKFSPFDFFKSERELRYAHPDLFRIFASSRNKLFHSPAVGQNHHIEIKFVQRRFHIDYSFPAGLPQRYQQRKLPNITRIRDTTSDPLRRARSYAELDFDYSS